MSDFARAIWQRHPTLLARIGLRLAAKTPEVIESGPDLALPCSYLHDIHFDGTHLRLIDAGKAGNIVLDPTGRRRAVIMSLRHPPFLHARCKCWQADTHRDIAQQIYRRDGVVFAQVEFLSVTGSVKVDAHLNGARWTLFLSSAQLSVVHNRFF